MTRAIIAAISGWGKSWTCQQWVEDNLSIYENLVVLDYDDEYRGLALEDDLGVQWAAIGRREASIGTDGWRDVLEDNPRLVAARSVGLADWREWCSRVMSAAQSLTGSTLIVVDEAHFVAPQGAGYPRTIKEVATTGRGNDVSSAWVTQRLQELDETVISQADTRLLGGFSNDRDLRKIDPVTSYPVEVHDPNHSGSVGQWDSSLSKFPASNGDGLEGSEWIYSDDEGAIDRIDTRDLSMRSRHYGGSDTRMDPPG